MPAFTKDGVRTVTTGSGTILYEDYGTHVVVHDSEPFHENNLGYSSMGVRRKLTEIPMEYVHSIRVVRNGFGLVVTLWSNAPTRLLDMKHHNKPWGIEYFSVPTDPSFHRDNV